MKNYTLVIFGATGDLAKRKLIPAIKAIAQSSHDFRITVLGIGRKEYTDREYIAHVLPDEELSANLSVYYHSADIEKSSSLLSVRKKLESVEPAETEGRIYYLATSYALFANIAKSIHSCCGEHSKGFTRIIAEKPFGHDLKSSKKLNRALRKYFSEEQIYRADHYLAKETVDNLLKIRLSNPVFESLWNSKSIAKIKMVVDEELGVGNRLGYYDNSGAIRDMVQNHLLQTISFVLMEPPVSLDNADFDRAKVEALKKLYFKNEIITGQYKGYQEEVKELNAGSKTETFVELKLHSKSKRWKGAEITLKTGKMLKKREAYIELEFKKEPCMLYCRLDSAPNKLIFHIQPLDNVELTMNTVLPGESENLAPVKMTFSKSYEFKANSPEGYEVILKECMLGNRRIFIGDKELDVAWKLTDKILNHVRTANITPVEYEQKGDGLTLKRT